MKVLGRSSKFAILCSIIVLINGGKANTLMSLKSPSGTLIDCQPSGSTVQSLVWRIIVGGVDHELNEYCTDKQTCNEYTPVGDDNSGQIRTNGLKPIHEGSYYCSYNNGHVIVNGSNTVNITILGRGVFPDCADSNVNTCNTNNLETVSEGSPLNISLPLIFIEGGARGAQQRIDFINMYHNASTPSFYFCNKMDCNKRDDTIFTGRISELSGSLAPWSNVSISITNTNFDDSGTYTLLVNGYNPNGGTNKIITSIFTVMVTPVTLDPTSSIVIPTSSSNSITQTPPPQPTTNVQSSQTDSAISTSATPPLHRAFTSSIKVSPTISTVTTPSNMIMITQVLIGVSVFVVVLLALIVVLVVAIIFVICRHKSVNSFDEKKQPISGIGLKYPNFTNGIQPSHVVSTDSESTTNPVQLCSSCNTTTDDYFSGPGQLPENYNSTVLGLI